MLLSSLLNVPASRPWMVRDGVIQNALASGRFSAIIQLKEIRKVKKGRTTKPTETGPRCDNETHS